MTECLFCTEKLLKAGEKPAALCCGHVFHERCIKTWFKTKKQCPTCKQTQKAATMRNEDGVIRLFLDAAGPSPVKSGGGGGAGDSVDLTENDEDFAPAPASEEVLVLRHSLLHAERDLEAQRRELDTARSTSTNLQEALRAEAEKSKTLWTQLMSSQRQGEMDVRKRDTEIRDLKQTIAAEQAELRQARSLKATFDAHQLDKEVCGSRHKMPQLVL